MNAYHKMRKMVDKEHRLAMLKLRDRAKEKVLTKKDLEDPLAIGQEFGMGFGPFVMIFTVEEHKGKTNWHLSVSCADRYPTWDELIVLRSVFFEDDMEVFQVMPSAEEYVNVHQNCFHLWHQVEGRIITLS